MTGEAARVREVEAKFRVHPPFRVPDLTGDPSPVARVDGPRTIELRAVYWDTSDLRFAREGVTLRHRTGEGPNDGWHLKLPVHEAGVPDASTGARDELLEVAPDDAIPARLLDLVSAYVRGAVVGPVATLSTTRSLYCLYDAEERPLVELADDLVCVLNQGHVAGRFREIEIEDVGGGSDVLRAVGDTLRAAGAVGGEFVPKVVRALGPQATAAPDPPPPGRMLPSDSTRAVVQAVLRRYVRNLMARDVEIRRSAPDAVHQMRVAARRLRSALKLFGPVVDPTWANALRDELAWLADTLGAARDAEVLLDRLHRSLDALPPELVLGQVRARIDQAVGGSLAAAATESVQTLRTERYLALVDRLVSAAWDPMTTDAADDPAGVVVPRLVADTWKRLASAAARVGGRRATDADWHRARIAAKQVRYAAEAVTPLFGRQAKTLAERAEAIQELLGEHQDAVVACAELRRLATGARTGGIGFTLGLLYSVEMAAIERTRHDFPALWADTARAKYRKWLPG